MSASNCHEAEKYCAVCVRSTPFEVGDRDDFAAVLNHYLDVHADHPHLKDVLANVCLEATCAECGSRFDADVTVAESSFVAAAYCDGCVGENQLRALIDQEVSPQQVIDSEVPE